MRCDACTQPLAHFPAHASTGLAPLPLDADFPCSLLVQDGDARIALDPGTGLNSYGCGCMPDPSLLEYGSATASTPSAAGFAAAQDLARLMSPWIDQEPRYRQTHLQALTQQIRDRLWPCLLGSPHDPLSAHARPQLLLSASGTDALRQAAALCVLPGTRLAVFMLEAEESGRGVPLALAQSTASRIHHIRARDDAGNIRPTEEVDQALKTAILRAHRAGDRIVLVLTDVSKTGLICPSLSCMRHLQQRLGSALQVVVDACQLRLAPETLRAYLAQGCLVALTGSKFMGGPSFSGALLIPAQHTLAPEPLNSALEQNVLAPGPLLRWNAALAEMEAFARIPGDLVQGFLAHFARQVSQFMGQHPRLELLPVRELDRTALPGTPSGIPGNATTAHPATQIQAADPAPRWDQVQTIFPFLLHQTQARGPGTLLERADMLRLFHQLPRSTSTPSAPKFPPGHSAAAPMRGRLGQPVLCGTRAGQEISALRLCASARLVLQGLASNPGEKRADMDRVRSSHASSRELWPDSGMRQAAADRCAQQACQFLEYILWLSALD